MTKAEFNEIWVNYSSPERFIPDTDEYRQTITKIDDMVEELEKRLSEKEAEMFLEYRKLITAVAEMEAFEAYSTASRRARDILTEDADGSINKR